MSENMRNLIEPNPRRFGLRNEKVYYESRHSSLGEFPFGDLTTKKNGKEVSLKRNW